MGISQRMTGSPFHIEKLPNPEGRRHKARCIHLRKEDNHCKHSFGICVGAAHCPYYKERPQKSVYGDVQHNFSSNVPPKNAETHEINTPKNTPYSNFKQDSTSQRLFKNTASQKYYVGTRVIHRGINANNSYGNGIVKAVFEKEIQIEFDGGILKKLPLNTCGNYLSIVSHPPRKSHNISQKNKNDINVHPPKKEVSKTISAQPLAESEPIPPPTQKEQPNNPIDQSETREICEICETSEQTILEETLPIQKEILEEKEETISTDPEPENSPAKSKTLTVAIFVLSVAILILLGLNFKNFTDFFQEL